MTPLTVAEAAGESEVLTVEEVAALLRLNRKTVYSMVQRNEIPGARECGRAIRFHRSTVLSWLASGSGRTRRRR